MAQKEGLEAHRFHVCVTTYETVAQEMPCLRKIAFEMLIIDEVPLAATHIQMPRRSPFVPLCGPCRPTA